MVNQHPGALSSLHAGTAVGAPTASAEVTAALPAPERSGHASGADMNGNGSNMVS